MTKLIGAFLKYVNVPKTNVYSKEVNNKPVHKKRLQKKCQWKSICKIEFTLNQGLSKPGAICMYFLTNRQNVHTFTELPLLFPKLHFQQTNAAGLDCHLLNTKLH